MVWTTLQRRVASFERLLSILEELNQAGADKGRVTELAKRLNDGKRYLKTEFKVNCSAEESECADHCRKFALSDPVDPCFNNQCSHLHNMVCEQWKQLKATLDEMEESIKKHSSHLYSQEQKHDLLYDFERSKNGIFFGNLMPYVLLTKNLLNKKPSNQSLLLMTGR